MEANLECPVCIEKFNSQNKRPKNLNCGHIMCDECAETLCKPPTYLYCPTCKLTFEGISADQLSDNFFILQQVGLIEVYCNNHPSTLGVSLHKQALIILCTDCSFKEEEDLVIDLEMIDLGKYLIGKAIDFEIENSSEINPETKRKIREMYGLPNWEKLEIVRDLYKKVFVFKCDTHLNNEAIWVNFETGEVSCEQCPQNFKSDFGRISEPETPEKMENHIRKRLTSVNYSSIPVEFLSLMKNFSSKNLENQIQLLKECMSFERVLGDTLLSPICRSCSQEFNLSNKFPLVLKCLNLHLVCEECWIFQENEQKCPIDMNEQQDLQRYLLSLHPIQCEICHEFYSQSRIPLILSCKRVCCQFCFESRFTGGVGICPFCRESHREINSIPRMRSQFFTEISQRSNINCIDHNEVAAFINTETYEAYCRACSFKKPALQSLQAEDFSLSEFLEKKCILHSKDPNFRSNPEVEKGISEVHNMTNSAKMVLLQAIMKLVKPVSLPAPMMSAASRAVGRELENLEVPCEVLTRFKSVLPPLNWRPGVPGPASSKPWYIDREKEQIEAVSFEVNDEIIILGFGIGSNIDKSENACIEFLDIIRGDSLNKNYLVRDFVNRPFEGEIVEVLYLTEKVCVPAYDVFTLVFKINSKMVFKGNPIDRYKVEAGSDGKVFEFKDPKNTGSHYTNGEHFLTGPLLYILYE